MANVGNVNLILGYSVENQIAQAGSDNHVSIWFVRCSPLKGNFGQLSERLIRRATKRQAASGLPSLI